VAYFLINHGLQALRSGVIFVRKVLGGRTFLQVNTAHIPGEFMPPYGILGVSP